MRIGIGVAMLLAAWPALAQVKAPPVRFEKLATCGGFLEGPTFSADGRLRVVDYLGGRVFELRGRDCAEIGQTGGMANGAKHDAQGRLWIADAVKGILRQEADGRFTAVIAQIDGQPLTGANDLVFDRKGGLYFTVPGKSSWTNRIGRIFYLPPGEGAKPQLFRENLPFPNGITLSPDGKYVFSTMFTDKSVIGFWAVDNEDQLVIDYKLIETQGGMGPDGMLTDSKGRLIWANFGGGSITVATPEGKRIAEIALPAEAGPMVTNIAERDGAYYLTEASKGEIWKVTGL